jgi:hypothetical protein
MAKRFTADKLAQRLAPFGFTLNLPETMQHGISFVRPSSIDRLYEHIRIHAGSPTYAEAVISAASFTSCHNCVSQRDHRLRAFLAGNSEYGSKVLMTPAEAKAWQQQLVDHADALCKWMAQEHGPLLSQQLAPVFVAVDGYTARLGDFFAILDREFAFVSEASPDEQAVIDRLATKARQWLYLNLDDAKLAALALVRFGDEVEGIADPFHERFSRKDAELASRLILLADYVRAKRLEYETAGGLYR